MKILYLYAKKWYDQKMSIGRWLYGQAVAQHPGVELKVSGVGWEGWNASSPTSHNILNMGWTPDLIWVYKPQDYIGLNALRIPRVITFNEANDEKKTREEVEAAEPEFVFFHHRNDVTRWWNEDFRICNIPHCAPTDIIKPLEKTIDCLSSGVQSKQVYPIRSQLHDLVATGQLPGKVRKHPGYRLQSHDDIVRQYGEYAVDLGHSKIALCCTSIHKYFLAKLVEAAAAGCVIATDRPQDFWFDDYLWHGSIELTGDVNRDRMKILSYLEETEMLEEIGERNRMIAERAFSMENYAQRFIEAVS